MATTYEAINTEQKKFINKQKIFFVGTAMVDGKVNVSPKGMDSLRVLDQNRIVWLNLTGSGNETATHLQYLNRMTIMWCAFDGKPSILRCYGTATCYHENDDAFQTLKHYFPDYPGSRQIVDFTIDLVQSSCGFAVPLMDYREDREVLKKWAEKKNKKEFKEYWNLKNTLSLDGKKTDIAKL